jgi:hypothetical protein
MSERKLEAYRAALPHLRAARAAFRAVMAGKKPPAAREHLEREGDQQ